MEYTKLYKLSDVDLNFSVGVCEIELRTGDIFGFEYQALIDLRHYKELLYLLMDIGNIKRISRVRNNGVVMKNGIKSTYQLVEQALNKLKDVSTQEQITGLRGF